MNTRSKEHGTILNVETQLRLNADLKPLVGTFIDNLSVPIEAAVKFEPSQIGTVIGTLVDALLPYIALKQNVGIKKAPGILGEREGYPDFVHSSGYRLELKGIFKDNPNIKLKKPPTPREPSARLTQKVTIKNVVPEKDALIVLVYQLDTIQEELSLLSPRIVDAAVFPVIECVKARDNRLYKSGGKWFGDYETPAILSNSGRNKLSRGLKLNTKNYGRKESEGYDYNEDTNFGKLKRIPYKPLHLLMKKHGCAYSPSGDYPTPWQI